MLTLKKLIDCELKQTLTIGYLAIEDREILDRLLTLGLYPHAKIKVICKKSIYILDIRGSRLTIPFDIAEKIFIE